MMKKFLKDNKGEIDMVEILGVVVLFFLLVLLIIAAFIPISQKENSNCSHSEQVLCDSNCSYKEQANPDIIQINIKYCPECGGQVNPDIAQTSIKYCPECGNSLIYE